MRRHDQKLLQWMVAADRSQKARRSHRGNLKWFLFPVQDGHIAAKIQPSKESLAIMAWAIAHPGHFAGNSLSRTITLSVKDSQIVVEDEKASIWHAAAANSLKTIEKVAICVKILA